MPRNALIIWAADVAIAAAAAADAADVVAPATQALDMLVDTVVGVALIGADLASPAQLLERLCDLRPSAAQQPQQPGGQIRVLPRVISGVTPRLTALKAEPVGFAVVGREDGAAGDAALKTGAAALSLYGVHAITVRGELEKH